jgi:hypothetical protein
MTLLGEINDLNIERLSVDLDPDIFMETLLFMIKNELIVYQAFSRKCEKSAQIKLEQEIFELKNEPDPDFERIAISEKNLDRFRDDLLKKRDRTVLML